MTSRTAITALLAGALAVQPACLTPSARAAVARDAVCLSGTTVGDTPGKPFTIIVPANRGNGFEARGLATTPCNGKEAQFDAYREKICDLARKAPQAVQQNFRRTYRLTPDELCAMADSLTGN